MSVPRESEEVREAQFVVERPCPENGRTKSFNQAHMPGFPFVVWVKWPPVASEHGVRVFWLTEKAIDEWESHFDSFAPELQSTCSRVCEHMGHLIE